MNRAATDTTLWDWRYGQTQAERLCAGLLHVEGFTHIDPQCPLGGPDGRKDILCTRDGLDWVAAVYFPPTRSTPADVKEKFLHDLEGVSCHDRRAFAFFTNQPVTPGERAALAAEAGAVRVEIYHQERIRSILDSPKGYGLRLEHLRIPMTEEEQLGLFSTLGDEITTRLIRQEAGILELHRKMDLVLERTMMLGGGAFTSASSMEMAAVPRLTQFPTADLRIGDIMWIHRMLHDGSGLPRELRGRFRSTMVWIGKAGAGLEHARFVPPAAGEVEGLLVDLVDRWRGRYPELSGSDEESRLAAIASFHHGFLSIHPFLDGNGRVARAILCQQVYELLGRYIDAVFTADPAAYYDTLSSADAGDMDPLVKLIAASLE
jgi:fido (protein-threonine AMPylation protein)